MLTVSFQSAALAIAQIFAMGAVGYCLVKARVMDEAGLKLLSFLSVNVCFPFFIFYQITHYFDPRLTHFWWGYPLINIILILSGLMVAIMVGIMRNKPLSEEFKAASSLHNAGYIPLLLTMTLPLAEMANAVHAAVIISIVGFDLCLWSLGVWLMTRKQQPQFDLKKMINPPLVSMSAAICIVLGVGEPLREEVLFKPVKIIGDSAMALAMMIIGGNLALTNLKHMDVRRIAPAVAIKLLILPTLALIALIFLRLDPIMSFVVMIQACMPTSVTLSIIGRHHNTPNQNFVNQAIFLSHLLAVITIPLFLGLYRTWVP